VNLVFPTTAMNDAGPLPLRVVVRAQDFHPRQQEKDLCVPPRGDSPPCILLLSAARSGQLTVVVELYDKQTLIAACPLQTQATKSAPRGCGKPNITSSVFEIAEEGHRREVTNDDARAGRFRNLALIYEYALTLAVRLRTGRKEIKSVESLHDEILSALRAAERRAASEGYNSENVRIGSFAVMTLLNDAILRSKNAPPAGSGERTIRTELFERNAGGELGLRRTLENLLAREESHDVIDVLELCQTCLLLGLRDQAGENKHLFEEIASPIDEKIDRVRGKSWTFTLAPEPPDANPHMGSERHVHDLTHAAPIVWILCVGLFFLYRLTLSASVHALGENIARAVSP